MSVMNEQFYEECRRVVAVAYRRGYITSAPPSPAAVRGTPTEQIMGQKAPFRREEIVGDSGRVTLVLTKLEQRGWVRRQPRNLLKDSSRPYLWEVTAKGLREHRRVA